MDCASRLRYNFTSHRIRLARIHSRNLRYRLVYLWFLVGARRSPTLYSTAKTSNRIESNRICVFVGTRVLVGGRFRVEARRMQPMKWYTFFFFFSLVMWWTETQNSTNSVVMVQRNQNIQNLFTLLICSTFQLMMQMHLANVYQLICNN